MPKNSVGTPTVAVKPWILVVMPKNATPLTSSYCGSTWTVSWCRKPRCSSLRETLFPHIVIYCKKYSTRYTYHTVLCFACTAARPQCWLPSLPRTVAPPYRKFDRYRNATVTVPPVFPPRTVVVVMISVLYTYCSCNAVNLVVIPKIVAFVPPQDANVDFLLLLLL